MSERKYEFHIYLNEEEKDALCKLSEITKLSKSQLIREIILGYSPPEGPPANYGKLIYQLRCLGNNINQILRIARTNGILNPVELEKHLSELRTVEEKMHTVFYLNRENNKWQ